MDLNLNVRITLGHKKPLASNVAKSLADRILLGLEHTFNKILITWTEAPSYIPYYLVKEKLLYCWCLFLENY